MDRFATGDMMHKKGGRELDTDMLNSVDDGSAPPAKLLLKVGAMCLLMKTFPKHPELKKNQKVFIHTIDRKRRVGGVHVPSLATRASRLFAAQTRDGAVGVHGVLRVRVVRSGAYVGVER